MNTCQLCLNEITDNLGLEVAPWGATCADCVQEMGIVITCDLCQTKTKDYSNGGFWNCLCETCWNKEKELI